MAHEKTKKRQPSSRSPRKTDDNIAKPSKTYDPALASLFESSLGPAQNSSSAVGKQNSKVEEVATNEAHDLSDEQVPSVLPRHRDQAEREHSTELESQDGIKAIPLDIFTKSSRKSKRKHAEDDLEGIYMQKLAREEAREEAIRRKKQRLDESPSSEQVGDSKASQDTTSVLDIAEIVTGDDNDSTPTGVPQHESLGPTKSDADLEKASRTVFLGNISNSAIKSKSGKKILLEHLASFLPSLPKQAAAHKIESLRFRSTAFASNAVPKKAAFAKKELMDSTTHSTNAYAVYTTQVAAREAVKRLNGTVILSRHLRVDSVAHPSKTDHRRCVFIGNLGFVDDENAANGVEDGAKGKRPRNGREPADLEEGLWRQFGKAGTIESVRVPRDKTTRVGKGFAYVQFRDPNGVEKALLFDGKKFPPMLPRTLRVTRAKNIRKTSGRQPSDKISTKHEPRDKDIGAYRPKVPSEVQSKLGRAGKLLGRAGAARFRVEGKRKTPLKGVIQSPESIVFEGYRASSKAGKGTLKLGGSGKKQGKPRTRSSRRGAAFKASGRKK